MPGTYDPRRDELRHHDWLALFVDRDEARAKIDGFLWQLADKYSKPEFPISAILWCQRARQETARFHKAQQGLPPRHPNVRIAFVELEILESPRVDRPAEVMWLISDALSSAEIMARLPSASTLTIGRNRTLARSSGWTTPHCSATGVLTPGADD